jgi:hypothetical protein
MRAVIRNFAFDCADPYEVARFWARVFDCPVDPRFEPDDEEVVIEPPGGTRLYFQLVPEPKRVKDRAHICLQPEVPFERWSVSVPSVPPSSPIGATGTAATGS